VTKEDAVFDVTGRGLIRGEQASASIVFCCAGAQWEILMTQLE